MEKEKKFFYNTLVAIRESYISNRKTSIMMFDRLCPSLSDNDSVKGLFFNEGFVCYMVSLLEEFIGDTNNLTTKFLLDTKYGTTISESPQTFERFEKKVYELWNDIRGVGECKQMVAVIKGTEKEFNYVLYKNGDDKVNVQKFLGTYLKPSLCGKDEGLLYQNKNGEKNFIKDNTYIVKFYENDKPEFLFLNEDVFNDIFKKVEK